MSRPRVSPSEFAEICLGLTKGLPADHLKDTIAWLVEYFVREFIPVECPPMWVGRIDSIGGWRLLTERGIFGDAGEPFEPIPSPDAFDEYGMTHALNGDDTW